MEAEIVAVGAGGPFREPIVIRGDGRCNMAFINFDSIFGGEVSGYIPSFHFHPEKFHVVFVDAVAEAGMAEFVE